MLKIWLTALLLLVFSGHSLASIEVYEFETETQEQRYQKFMEELRCPKCKNNNLAGTNSKIAIDLRRQLQTMVKEGKTDQEIVDYMVLRYGDFVLYRPRLQPTTFALWYGPPVFAGIGIAVVGVIVWRRRRKLGAEPTTLTEAEVKALRRLLKEDDTENTHPQQ